MRRVIEIRAPRAEVRVVRPVDIQRCLLELDVIRYTRPTDIQAIRDFFLTGINPLVYAFLLETHPEFYCDQLVINRLTSAQLLNRLKGMYLVLSHFNNDGYDRSLIYTGVADLRLINGFYLSSLWDGQRPSFEFSIERYPQYVRTPRVHGHDLRMMPQVHGHPPVMAPPSAPVRGMAPVGYHQHSMFHGGDISRGGAPHHSGPGSHPHSHTHGHR